MSKIIKKAFGDSSHYKIFRYPFQDESHRVHEGDTINNGKLIIRWINNDQRELYFYNDCLTKIQEIEPKLCVYRIDNSKDLVIGWKQKDEATPRVEFDKHDIRERVVTEAGVEVTSDTVLHVGDKLHFENTLFSNIQRFETEAYDPDSITWTRSKTITDYGEIQLNYQKVDLRNVDNDPKTPFNMVSNPKANLVITNPYDNNKVVHAGDNVFYKHNFFHATMNENYAFNPDGSHYIELVDASTNLYRITDRAPFFNIKYVGKVKIVIQDPSDWTAEYFTAEGSRITNNQMMQVGSIIKIRLSTDTVDLKNMPNHTTLVGQTFWNSDDDPYDLRKEYSVKIDVDESLSGVMLKPPQPQPSTVFKTNADIYNNKVKVESHLNHINADPLPSDPSWFHQNEVVQISFKGDYGVTGYKIESVQNAVHVGEDYYYATSPECIINVSEVTDYKLHILKSAPGVTEEECGVYDPAEVNKKYPDGAILALDKIIRVIPKDNFIIDQDRFVDLELIDPNINTYKVTGLNPTVECKQVNAIIHIPDEAHVDVFTVPGNEQIHDNDITQKLNNQLKVIPKYPYKLKNNAIAGMEVVDADNGIYKITEYTVTIELEELEFASIDALPADIFKVKTVRTPIQEITTFPNNNTLRITDKFTLEFKNSDDGIKYDVGVTGATLVSGNTYRVESNIVSIIAEDKQVTVHIPNPTHVTVTKHPSNTPVVDGDTTVKILDILKIVPEEGYKVSTTTGLEVEPLNENCYKVKETNVVIDVETYPFITINNQNTDVLAVCTTNNISTAISAFPNSDKIRKTASFYILYKGSNNTTTHSIVVTGATLVSGNKYIATEDSVEVKAVPKFTPSKINISGEITGVTVKAVDDGRELHDGDTSVKVDDKITVVLKPTYKFEVPMTGVDATGNSNEYKITDTEVTIKVKQIQFVTIDNEFPTIITVKTIDPEEEITTFPCTDKLQEGQSFSVTFKNPADAVQYTLSVIGANHTTGDQYIPTANSVTIKAVRKVVIHIPDETHVQVTKVPENTQIHNNDNTLAINDQIKIVAIPKWEYKLKPVVGATVVDADNGIYKITAVDVTIEAESVPFITINNDNQDIVAVYTEPGNGGRITTFPCSDKVHQNQDIYVKYVNETTQKPVYDISVVGAIANTEEYSYKAGVVDITVSASRKVLSTTIHIDHADHVTVKAVDDNRELHDGDTSVNTTQFITIVPKAHWHMKPALLRGLEATSEENKFMVIDREVFIDVEEDQVVTINNLKKALLKVEVGAITLNTFPDSTHLHMDEEFVISFFNASLDPKYDLNVTGAAFITTVGHNHKYKATSSNVIVDAELKPVPATIHITGDANIDVTTVPGGVAIHDGDTSQFVGNKLKIVPKHGYKLNLPLSGIDVEDVSNNIYKITDENVTIEAVLIPFVTINNESTDLLKVVTASVPSEELTVFPCSDKVHEDENFIVSFKLASNATKYDVVVTGATRVAGNIYKATTDNITVKAEAKFPPATIHIIDGDHVDVADATSGRVILDNDTLMFVGDAITVVPKSGYRLKQKVGLELLSKSSKLYKIANASVTIEVEEIPTPPAPPPGSTHNTILRYLKSLFYGGV